MSPSTMLLVHMIIYGVCAAVFQVPLQFMTVVQGVVLSATLIWISIVDFDRFEVPDAASFALLATGGLSLFLLPSYARLENIVAGVLFPLVLLVVALAFRALRGRQGLGLGDVKLAAGIGLWVGLTGTVFVLFGAALAALATLTVNAMARGELAALRKSGIAFAPFLCLFTWVIWLKGLGA